MCTRSRNFLLPPYPSNGPKAKKDVIPRVIRIVYSRFPFASVGFLQTEFTAYRPTQKFALSPFVTKDYVESEIVPWVDHIDIISILLP